MTEQDRVTERDVTKPDRLRAITFLSPGIPLSFFEALVEFLSDRLGCEIDLVSEERHSGPMSIDADVFAAGQFDLGFVCSPSFLYMRYQTPPSVSLVGAGLVFGDPRNDGRPVYFSDVVVRQDSSAQVFEDLRGSTWGYNDKCSLSGYFATLQQLHTMKSEHEFFGKGVVTGSHLASLAALLDGTIDVAAIDSTVLAYQFEQEPKLATQLRVVESLGPFPSQPIVARVGLDPALLVELERALLAVEHDQTAMDGRGLRSFGLVRCASIDEQHFDEERQALCDLGQLKYCR